MKSRMLRRWSKAILVLLGVGSLWICLMGAAKPMSPLSGQTSGEQWLVTPQELKLAYCQSAYRSFRNSPSQSYIISSNVQALTPESFCKRLDQFYSYDINMEIPLGQASGIAPLLFSDQPIQN